MAFATGGMGLACLAQQAETIRMDLLFEIAQIFPHYLVYDEEDFILMRHVTDQRGGGYQGVVTSYLILKSRQMAASA